jgi:hypothetical protein
VLGCQLPPPGQSGLSAAASFFSAHSCLAGRCLVDGCRRIRMTLGTTCSDAQVGSTGRGAIAGATVSDGLAACAVAGPSANVGACAGDAGSLSAFLTFVEACFPGAASPLAAAFVSSDPSMRSQSSVGSSKGS